MSRAFGGYHATLDSFGESVWGAHITEITGVYLLDDVDRVRAIVSTRQATAAPP